MRKQMTISLRSNKNKVCNENTRPASHTSFTEVKPHFRYRPLGYSIIMNQNRPSVGNNRKVNTEMNDESILEIDDKIQQLIEQNERLTTTLKSKHSKQPSFGKEFHSVNTQELPRQNIKPSVAKSPGAIDFDRIYTRMEKLEQTIESQHKEIEYLRSISQAQTERAQQKQIDDIENLIHKNQMYSEMITHQQQEIENYKNLTIMNNQLKHDNQELLNQIRIYDEKVDQYQKCQQEIEKKIKEVLNENAKLNESIRSIRKNNSRDIESVLNEKDYQIEQLLKEVESLVSQIKIEEEENAYLRNLKIAEMKQMIINNSNKDTPQQRQNASQVNSFKSDDQYWNREDNQYWNREDNQNQQSIIGLLNRTREIKRKTFLTLQ